MQLRAISLRLAPAAALLTAFACGGVGETDLFGTGGSGSTGTSSSGSTTSSSGSTTSSSGSTTSSSSTSSSSGGGGAASSSSSSSGSFCGNGMCEPGEDAVFCPQDCTTSGPSGSSSSSGGGTCDHDPCAQGGPLATACDTCAAIVCPADPYCCDTAWDGQCVNEAAQMCPQCGSTCGNNACDNGETCSSCPADCGACPPTTCEHSVCFVGNKLDPMLCKDPCVDDVCMQQASCCGGPNWNQGCQDLADMLCPATDPCVSAVCAADPTCCTASWTQACVDQATMLCNTACDCPHSICVQGEKLTTSCNPCVAAVCFVDDYCCNQTWDGICVGEVDAICGIPCQ